MPNDIDEFNTLQSLLVFYLGIMNSNSYTLGSGVGTIEVLELPKISLKQRAINFLLRPYICHLVRKYDKKLHELARRVRRRPSTGNAIQDLRLNIFELKWLNRGYMRYRWRRWAVNSYCYDWERNERVMQVVEALRYWCRAHEVYNCLRLLEKEIDTLNRNH